MEAITYEEFELVDLCSGTIIKAEEFVRARKPAFNIWADFGPEIGVLQTSSPVNLKPLMFKSWVRSQIIYDL